MMEMSLQSGYSCVTLTIINEPLQIGTRKGIGLSLLTGVQKRSFRNSGREQMGTERQKPDDAFAPIFISGDEQIPHHVPFHKREVYRYLMAREGADETTDRLVKECMQEIRRIARYQYVYRQAKIASTDSSVFFEGATLELPGKDICKHLAHCDYAVVMAVTLGMEVEQVIRYYSRSDLTRGVLLDACATALVEALCDDVQEKVRQLAEEAGYFITPRWSPGYGDLPLTVQAPLLDYLNAFRRIGLYLSESSILLPRKSVSAIIGVTKEKREPRRRCSRCHLFETCRFSREGEAGCAR